jgi:hypothetical protein
MLRTAAAAINVLTEVSVSQTLDFGEWSVALRIIRLSILTVILCCLSHTYKVSELLIFFLFVCFLQDIREGATYKVKFWLRSTASLSLSVSFTSADGSQTLAQETVESVSTPHFETSNSINKVK